MIALVVGGSASGKSKIAEQVALGLPGPHYYIATMRHGDAETEARIARHMEARSGCGFQTVELAHAPERFEPRSGTVLVEDLSNLLLNGLADSLEPLLLCGNAVVVTNAIGSDGVAYDDFTEGFICELGAASCQVASRADVVIEVVAGIPSFVKGELPWAC